MQTYFIRSTSTGRVKIGRSKNPEARLRDLSTAAADELVLLGVLEGDRELEMHAQFSDARVRGEWFDLTPALSDLLKASFGCVFPEPTPSDRFARFRKTIVESWSQVTDRAEVAFGVGLRRGDHVEYCDAAYDFYFRVCAQRAAEDRERFGTADVAPSAEELGRNPDAPIHEEMDRLIWGPQEWFDWVLGWTFVDETEHAPGAVCLLFKKPGTPAKIEHLARAIAGLGAAADAFGVDLRVAIAVRRRTDSNEWIGEILGPASIDDEADIWGLETGFLTPIIVDSKLSFQLLGDAWYRHRGLPTPAEENLVT